MNYALKKCQVNMSFFCEISSYTSVTVGIVLELTTITIQNGDTCFTFSQLGTLPIARLFVSLWPDQNLSYTIFQCDFIAVHLEKLCHQSALFQFRLHIGPL